MKLAVRGSRTFGFDDRDLNLMGREALLSEKKENDFSIRVARMSIGTYGNLAGGIALAQMAGLVAPALALPIMGICLVTCAMAAKMGIQKFLSNRSIDRRLGTPAKAAPATPKHNPFA